MFESSSFNGILLGYTPMAYLTDFITLRLIPLLSHLM
jgi:hypothetical protein